MTRVRLFVALLSITTLGAVAGIHLGLKCENPKCGYRDLVGLYGGFNCSSITGYCTTCSNFVSISWSNYDRTNEVSKVRTEAILPRVPPAPVGNVWNPATSLTANLYPCPKCKKPFMEVNYQDFWVVPKKVSETVDRFLMKEGALQDEQLEALVKACHELEHTDMMICPKCTNLTLRLSRQGTFD